jgi:hypothetical protein
MKTTKKAVNTATTRKNNRNANRTTKRITPEGVIELNEGVTGAMFTKAKRDTNNAVKQKRSNISQCILDAFEEDKNFFSSFNKTKTQLRKEFRPNKLIVHATDYELTLFAGSLDKLGYVKFNVWGTLTMIKRYVDKKVAKARAEREAKEQASEEQK